MEEENDLARFLADPENVNAFVGIGVTQSLGYGLTEDGKWGKIEKCHHEYNLEKSSASGLYQGIDEGWVTEPFCNTHDIDPAMGEEEQAEWDDGLDPCQHVLRIMV